MNPLLRSLVACTVLVAVAPAQQQALRFAHVFADHAVLQGGEPVRLWGLARPGAAVEVVITEDEAGARRLAPQPFAEADAEAARQAKQRQRRAAEAPGVRMHYRGGGASPLPPRELRCVADDAGRWRVEAAAMPASFTPKFVVARSGDEAALLRDVLVGEVWLCSGQSNMVWGVGSDSEWGMEQLSVDFPAVRYCKITHWTSEPLDDLRNRVRWSTATPDNGELGRFSGVSYFFATRLHRVLKVPVGIVNNAVGGSLAETWTSRATLEKLPSHGEFLADFAQRVAGWPEEKTRQLADWERRVAKAKADGKNAPRKPRLEPPDADRNQPAGCYNASIHPIRHLALRGALFLQGENNSIGKWGMYAASFPAMIADWRAAFGAAELPFGIITVQGFGPYGRDVPPEMVNMPSGLFWYAAIRDVHFRTHRDVPHTGLIAAADVGDTANIHPGLKREVGQRAARWALAQVYGKKILSTGPVYRSMQVVGGAIELKFDMDPNLDAVVPVKPGEVVWWRDFPISRVGKDYRGFLIAGADRRFYPAEVRRGKTPGCLLASSPHVKEPVAVRYAWAGYPDANAVGHDFLPVHPFRTDDWELYPDTPSGREARDAWSRRLKADRERAETLALGRRLRDAASLLQEVERSLGQGRSKEERAALQEIGDKTRALLRQLRERVESGR